MPMPHRRPRRAPGPRATLVWGLLCFAGLQLALAVAVEVWFPVLRDPEYGYKLAGLRRCLAQAPGRPLVLVLGSSRVGMGFRPDALPPLRPAHGPAPLVYNFAFTGAGPVGELVRLRGLLHEGIRPDWVILEIHPALLHQDRGTGEEAWTSVIRLSWHDLGVLARYTPRSREQYRSWLSSRLLPGFAHRFCILSRVAPGWLPWSELRQDGWQAVDPTGWLPYGKTSVTPEEYHRGMQFAFKQYLGCFHQYRITPRIDAAIREALDVCRGAGIRAVLLTMPEGEYYQSWYGPAALAQIDAYVRGLSREYQVPWVDARSWCPAECFFDNHHLLPSGAAFFTERFGREVLQPLVDDPARWARSRLAPRVGAADSLRESATDLPRMQAGVVP
jgi:hypothetical protein